MIRRAKIGTAAVAAASTAVVGLATSAIKSYAEYEQLVGGVETLFKENASVVQGYAEQAYKKANMSANKYMETVTSFSASLLQGLGGDTAKAAEYADMAVRDMSDNANKFGTDISMIQNAYQGFAKRNYTMLDNLKLGYGGTASEMARLINDSGVLGDTVTVTASNINRVSFDTIVDAIHKVQDEMGITGTTANEAATTIQGSINTMKGAWQNLLTSIPTGEDVDEKLDTFLDSVGTFGDNLLPKVKTTLSSLTSLVNGVPDDIELSDSMKENLSGIAEEAGNLVGAFGNLIVENSDEILDAGTGLLTAILDGISSTLGKESTKEGIKKIANDIVSAIGDADMVASAAKTGASIVDVIAETLSDPNLWENAGVGAANILASIGYSIDAVGGSIVTMVENLITEAGEGIDAILADPEGWLQNRLSDIENWLEETEKKYYQSLSDNLNDEQKEKLLEEGKKITENIAEMTTVELMEHSKDIFNNFNDILADTNKNIEENGVSEEMENHVTESNKKGFFEWVASVFFRKKPNYITGSHANGLSYVPFDGYIAELHKGERVLTSKEAKKYNSGGLGGATINITINGAQYNSEESLAEAVAYKIQQMINGKGAAYA